MTSASSVVEAPGSSAARRRRAIAFSRRNFFQSLTLVLTSRSVTICSTPYPASAAAAHQGAPETGQNAINRSTTNSNIQHTPVNPTLHRAPVTTNSSQGGGGQGNQTQTTIKSRSVQPQERVYSQPKTPQTYTQPKGPQNYEHAVPQTHTPPPPPPPPQVQRNVQHAQPQERKVPAEKKKDKDDNGGHR